MLKWEFARSRLWAAITTGGVALVLLWLLLMPGTAVSAAGVFAVAVLGAGLLLAWAMRRRSPPRSAWGAGCFINGWLSTAVALSFRVQDDLWAGHSRYAEDLDRAIGPLTGFVWALAARIGLIALIMAAILFAASWWLLGPPHRKA